MQLAIVILFVLMTAFLCLFVSKAVDCKNLQEENKEYKKREDRIAYQIIEDGELNVESIMRAVRYNGYVPDYDGEWITFMVQGERYFIGPEDLPVIAVMKWFRFDRNIVDMDLMHKAAVQVTNDMIMIKVDIREDEENILEFHIISIEQKYGHFKDCLTRYVDIIGDAQSKFMQIYNEMVAQREETLSTMPTLESAPLGEKKILS